MCKLLRAAVLVRLIAATRRLALVGLPLVPHVLSIVVRAVARSEFLAFVLSIVVRGAVATGRLALIGVVEFLFVVVVVAAVVDFSVTRHF